MNPSSIISTGAAGSPIRVPNAESPFGRVRVLAGPVSRVALFAFTSVFSAQAQLPTARLDSVFPAGMRAGTDAEVTIAGTDLDDVDRLLFSDAGLSATRVEGAKFKVTASSGMAPGYYEVRAAGKYGISASRIFAVGTVPEVNEPADNRSAAKALGVTLPVTVNGTAGGDGADWFRFHAAAGQKVSVTCAAERVDSPLNAVVTVVDAAGRELHSAHRTRQSDAGLEFSAPGEGDYFVKVHDMTWQSGLYRLTISSPAEIAAVDVSAVPLSGALCGWMPVKPVVESGAPASVPAVMSGTGSKIAAEFTGAAGKQVIIDLLSHRLGQPSDWFVQVFRVTRDDKGAEKLNRIAEFDDTAGPQGMEMLEIASRDPSGSITCEAGAVYRVKAVDRFQAGKPWRLVLRDPQPGFSLVAFSVSPVTKGPSVQRWSPFLRKGGSALLSVAVLRRDGFDGAVKLTVDGLPAGVSAAETVVPAGISTASIVVRAAPDAKAWSGHIRINGSSGEMQAAAHEAVPRWSVGNTGTERLEMRLGTDGLVLAVTDAEAAPLAVEPAEQKTYETALGGSIEVPVKFNRDASLTGFKGEWEAVLMGLPGLRQAPVVKPAADAKEAKLVLDLKRKDGNEFVPGVWNCYATARGTIKWKAGEKAPEKEVAEAVWSGPIQVKINPSPVTLTVPGPVHVAPGAKAEVPLKIERRFGFADAVTVELAGVKGISAEKLTIAKEAAEGKLIVSAAADAAPGSAEVTLNAKCTWNGQELPWPVKLMLEVKP